ncbi:MAG: acyltransferase family protein [Planctomycetota bacterium]|jgi:fucose 4-O-acetylase-like acetyltransferase
MTDKIFHGKSQLNNTSNLLSSDLQLYSREIVWVYWAKAVGIFLVLWGHNFPPHVILSWIFSFHMPLFFFISGYLTKNKHTIAFRPYVKKYAYSLLIPYVCLGFLAYIIWLVKNLFHPGVELDSISLWDPLWGMLYASGMPIFSLIHSSALWFLPALFSAFLFHWIAKKLVRDNLFYFIIAVILFIIGYFSFMYLPFRLPMGIENAMLGFLFFATGNIANKKQFVFNKSICFFGGIVCLAFQILFLYFQKWPIPSLLSGQIGNPIVYYITAMLGICFLVGMVSNLPRVAAVVTVSKNTLAVFTLQTPLKLCISAVFYLLHIPCNPYSANLIFGFGSAVFSLCCLSLFSDIVRKRWPVILGEK